jgi:hypothetical protein
MRLTTPLVLFTTCIAMCVLTTPVLASSGCPNEAIREAQHSTFLPDCRAYEMVSPPDKNGGDVLANSQRTHAAADGAAVMFSSLTPFADAVGTGVATDYMAERSERPDPGSNGWSTHAVTPPQTPEPWLVLGLGSEVVYQGELSADLSKGVVRTFSPLTVAPNVASILNLYLRDDLRTPGLGRYRLLNDCLAPPAGPCSSPLPSPLPPFVAELQPFRPWLAGASDDFSHVIFETSLSLTTDAPFGFPVKLYESDGGPPSLVGLVPPPGESECVGPVCVPAESSIAGQGAAAAPNVHYTPHAISADGTRIFFTADPSGCGEYTCGELYMRTDNGTPSATTVQLNASERTDCSDHNPCGGTPEPDPNHDFAAYWDASADGSRVFFTSTEALTDDAPLGRDRKLYMYDASLPASDPHNLTLLNVDNAPGDTGDALGVIGASNDGRYVYFINGGQLVAGKPLLHSFLGVFLWHDGHINYVGRVTGGDLGQDLSNGGSVVTFPKEARVSADGRALLFNVQADHRELYVYRADVDKLSCASCDPSGAPATSDASTVVKTGTGASTESTHLNHAISDDGRFVFFSTAQALVPADSNGRSDAYEYDTDTGRLTLLSSGTGTADNYFLDASTSGDDAFILSRDQLTKWDTDQNYDIYDVRVHGGFPEPPAAASPCSGEGCQASPSAPPSFDTPPSSVFAGAGNPAPPRAGLGHPSTGTRRLAKALRACKKKRPKPKRKRCEARVRQTYGSRGRGRSSK